MDLSDLIKKHAEELAAAAKDAAQDKRTEADLSRPAALYRARIARVDARLKLLQRQRDETDARLAAAIEAQKRLRDELEKEAKTWEERAPSPPTPRPQPTPRPNPRPAATSEKPTKARRTAAGKAPGAMSAKKPKSSGSGKTK